MKNFKQTVETQKAINEAVEGIFTYFREESSYVEVMESMTDAQMEFMEMMELNRHITACPSLGIDTVPTADINSFIYQASRIIKLLRPFANLMGQIYGNEE